jgi:hypothetical protein
MAEYSLALGVKPLQLEDPLTSYGRFATIQSAQNQNALAQYQLAAAQRAEGQQNALYEQAQMPGFKLDFPTAIKFGPPGIAAYKAQREAETQGLQAQELRGKIAAQPGARAETEAKTNRYNEQVRESQTKALGNGLMQALNNPDDNTLKSVFDRLEATGIPTATFREQFAAMPDLAARKQVIRQYALSNPEGIAALQFTSPKPEKFSLGGREISVDMNPNSETYKQEIKSFDKTATPDALMADARLKAQHIDQLGQWDKLNAAEKARLQETYRNNNLQDSRSRAQLAETIANNARSDRRKAEEFGLKQEELGLKKQEAANKQPGAQDQANALKALKTAGFNPETGEDEVSKLISKSTSGLIGTAADVAAGAFGKSTEGAKAISQIETRLNQIALDLAGGKLGAGISNEDRKFIVSTLGDAANPLKPKETRLAAWSEAKQRMLSAGVISGPAAGGAASSVIDSLVDKYAPKGK